MLNKTILLFFLLIFVCGEVFGQDGSEILEPCMRSKHRSCTCGDKPEWFDEYCSDTTRRDNHCLDRLIGIDLINEWNKEYFDNYGETTTTMYSFESGTSRGHRHRENQMKILKSLVHGNVIQYVHFNRKNPYTDYGKFPSTSGSIVTVANLKNFLQPVLDIPIDFESIQSVVVTGTGNDNEESKRRVLKGLKSKKSDSSKYDHRNSPFPIGAGGFDYGNWVNNCNAHGDCGLHRANASCPRSRNSGSNVCGDEAKELCLLGPYEVPVFGGGTSVATAYIGGVIWAVAYFLKNKYKWVEPMTQLQAVVTAVAIIKSCAIDMGMPGPDYEHGLGRLSVECLNNNRESGGFIANPLSVIKPWLHLPPNDSYTTPTVVAVEEPSTPTVLINEPNTIYLRLKVFLEGAVVKPDQL